MKLPEFIKLATNIEEVDDSMLRGTCFPKNTSDINLLTSSSPVQGSYDLLFIGVPEINKEVEFTFSPFKNYGYAGYKDFFRNAQWWTDKYCETERSAADKIIIHLWAEQSNSKELIEVNKLHLICCLGLKLCRAAHLNGSTIIFFGKKATEISLNLGRLEDFLLTAKNLSVQQVAAIARICNWLDDSNDRHLAEKKSILSSAMSCYFPEASGGKYNFHHILMHISEINEDIAGQYELYLENFSYEKFLKKLEENAEKFTQRITDTLGKVFSQTLALPIAAASLQALRNESTIAYAALLIACALCFFALIIQFEVLGNIKEEVDNFQKKGKIPSALKNTWDLDQQRIKGLICRQRWLGYVLISTVLLCAGFSVFQLLRNLPSPAVEAVSSNTKQNSPASVPEDSARLSVDTRPQGHFEANASLPPRGMISPPEDSNNVSGLSNPTVPSQAQSAPPSGGYESAQFHGNLPYDPK